MDGKINWAAVDKYLRHVAAVFLGLCFTLGVIDPVTGQAHISDWRILRLVLISTAVSLLINYAQFSTTKAGRHEQ